MRERLKGGKRKGFKQEEISELYGSKRMISVLCVCLNRNGKKRQEVTYESMLFIREKM